MLLPACLIQELRRAEEEGALPSDGSRGAGDSEERQGGDFRRVTSAVTWEAAPGVPFPNLVPLNLHFLEKLARWQLQPRQVYKVSVRFRASG